MGSDSFTIHTDGVIERRKELEPILLNILEIGSHRMSPLAAYKARRKCFKIAKNNRGIDYKEFVERLQIDHYPNEFKRSEYGRSIIAWLHLIVPSFFIGIIFILEGIAWDFIDAAFLFGVFGIPLLLLSSIGIWRVIKLVKRIKGLDNK